MFQTKVVEKIKTHILCSVMLDTPCSEVVWWELATHSIRQFPPSLPYPCVTVCHHISTWIYISAPCWELVYLSKQQICNSLMKIQNVEICRGVNYTRKRCCGIHLYDINYKFFGYNEIKHNRIRNKKSIYCKYTIYFRRHNNIMVYLLNFNITYINYFGYMFRLLWVIFRPWFQELLYILFYSFFVFYSFWNYSFCVRQKL